MPPTAIEIKARLDKAVDQEGNVLDMEAVLEIVASLERIVMTKEALEATRIGKTINLMRKKTSNEDLSKRAKKLVKRWQTVVSNHLKKSIKSENINGVVKRKEIEQAGSVNGNKAEAQYASAHELESKHGTKRKRSSPDNCSLNVKSTIKPGLSPRLVSSLKLSVSHKQGVSPKLNVSAKPENSPDRSVMKAGISPKLVSSKHGVPPQLDGSMKRGISPQLTVTSKPGLSPKLDGSPKHRGSPKVKSKTDPLKAKVSDLPSGEDGNQLSLISSPSNDKHLSELNRNNYLVNHSHENNNEPEIKDWHNKAITSPEKCCNDNTNNSSDTDATATNSTDTRVQENRIVLSDFISTNNSLSNSIGDSNEINMNSKNIECKPVDFTPIEPEDLVIVRRELPEDIIAPQGEADGVNGVYNGQNSWRSWTENVEQRNNELLLLPYVLLD